jgi:hypothetical protein
MTVTVSKAVGDKWVVARAMDRIAGPFDTKQQAVSAARRKADSGEKITTDSGGLRKDVIREGDGDGVFGGMF